ncbi:MAG TPA: ABC transporter substrate-binding protein [Solirubrobacteraceae bacterium]|nr:ABC transporter substrate-binding protein [Solirubrobacteraceae bacterium]
MRRTARKLALLAGALVATTALAACGEKKDVLTPTASKGQTVNLMLDWLPNADHVGIYDALARGDFARAGLDVHIQTPTDPASPLQLLAAGKVDVAISYEPELMLARDKGEPLVAIGAIVQRPLTSIVSLAYKHITSPSQLRGKRVGDAGIGYQHAFLQTILRHAGVPPHSVTETNVGANLVPALISGRIDAALGAYWNYEAIQLAQQGKHPHIIHMENAGVPTYDELVLVTTENAIATKTNELRRFVQALGRGYGAVRSNPRAGVDALVQANPSLSPKLQLASVDATLTSFFPHDPKNPNLPWGWQSYAQWTAFGEWMLHEHLISNPATIPGAETNQLLAGQGP